MGPLLTIAVAAQTAFWAWATLRLTNRAKARRATFGEQAPFAYPAIDWLGTALFGLFALGSFAVLLGYE